MYARDKEKNHSRMNDTHIYRNLRGNKHKNMMHSMFYQFWCLIFFSFVWGFAVFNNSNVENLIIAERNEKKTVYSVNFEHSSNIFFVRDFADVSTFKFQDLRQQWKIMEKRINTFNIQCIQCIPMYVLCMLLYIFFSLSRK